MLSRISIDPNVCFGKPRIKDTRIWVSLLLDRLADGESEAQILADYTQLTPADFRAAIAYGAEMAREHFIPVGTQDAARNSSWTKTSASADSSDSSDLANT